MRVVHALARDDHRHLDLSAEFDYGLELILDKLEERLAPVRPGEPAPFDRGGGRTP